MDELTAVTLRQLVGPTVTTPTVVRLGEADTVILDLLTPDLVEVWQAGEFHQRPADETAVPVTDAVAWQTAIRRALLGLTHQVHQTNDQASIKEQQHAATLAQIRRYAIEAHQNGTICRLGLNTFLSQFGLAPYQPRLVVTFVAKGRYEVNGTDAEAARTNADTRLKLTTSGICSLDQAATTHATRITAITPVSSDEPHLKVEYEVSGRLVVRDTDIDHALMDMAGSLAVDLTAIPGRRLGTEVTELHLGRPELTV